MMIVKRKRKDRKKSVDNVPASSLPVVLDNPEASSDWLIRSPIHLHTATVSGNNANNNGIGGGGKRKLYKRLHSEEANSSNKSGLLKKTKQKGSLDSFSGFVKRHSFDSVAAANKASFSNGPIENADRFPAEYPEPEHLSERRTSAHRVSYRKAIQKAGYNMNELVSATTAGFSPNLQQRSIQKTELDWTESAVPDDHLWAPTNASGDLCYVGEQNCHKSGPRKKCSACHIVVHDSCYSQLVRIGFQCKTTFREATSRTVRESMIVHHHWVHRRKQEGKCKHCGKSFEKRFGFREPTKIVAISCSWCKETFHNKVGCFQMHKINEPCSMGDFARSIVPPTWITKASQKQKSLRNRSKKKRGSGGTWRKKSSRDNRQKTFAVRPMPHQAAFVSPTLVFINPKSGGNQGAKLMQAFQWAINPRQIFDLSKGGPQEGLELYRKVPNLRILACGGDGTVGWILSVIDKMNLSRPPPVAILPLGTGNDLSRTLNFGPGYSDEPIHKILHGVEEAKLAKLDRWKLRVEKNGQALVTSRHEDADDNSLSAEEPQITGVDKPPLDVVNNYFSIGSDAQVTLSFHESREAHPSKFNSRIGNKMYYMRRGVYEYVNRQQKDLSKHITVVCDGVNITPKIRDLKPVCIVFLNIQRYSAGTSPWGHPTGTEFTAQRHDDKLIEVLAFSLNQLGMIFVGGHGDRLCQCKEAYIRTYKTFPVQIDGEPCRLNPSNIKFEFFNQANVLYKSKRRPSTAMEPNQHEQIKIRLNMVSNTDFDEQYGSKSKLVPKATPFLVTVAMSNSTLDVLRVCLDNHNASDKGDSNSDRWFFLDSSDEEKFYRIDRGQENLHLVCDVITSERELYILEVQDPLTPPVLHFPLRTRAIDRRSIQFRGRIQSDSGLQAYSDDALVDLSEVAKKISATRQTHSADDESPHRLKPAPGSPQVVNSRSSLSPLDVVFEQADDNNNTNDVSEGFEPISEKTPSQSDPPDGDYDAIEEPQAPVESKAAPKEKDEKIKAPETCSSWSSITNSPVARSRGNTLESDSSYSTSSNEYVIHDDVLPRNRNASVMTQRAVSPSKSPLRPAHSTPPAYKGQLLGAYVNQMDESGRKESNKKKHRRSNTDTDPKKALSGGQMLLSSFVKTMKLSGHNNNSNNNNINAFNKESCRSCDDMSRHCTRHQTHNDVTRRHSVGGQPLLQLERVSRNKKTTLNPPNEKDHSWDLVLLDAAMRGDEEKMRRAVGEGADLLATDENGRNALHRACSSTHLGIVRFLIKKMPNMVNVTDQLRQSGLHKAALAGALDVCEELVEAGATIGLVDCMGKSVLDRAKQVDSPRLVDYLRTVQSSKVKAAMISSPETDI